MRLSLAILLAVGIAGASAQDVTITGGVSEDRHTYQWTVTNHRANPITNRANPITNVEFPHYNADLVVFVPNGWTTQATTGLVGRPQTNKGTPPRFIASVPDPLNGIQRGKSASFGLRVAPSGAFPRKCAVTVTFADGTRLEVPGVECPGREPWLRRNFPVVGLGGCFVVFVAIRHLIRKRKSRP